jgi:hypothetical protein
VWAVLIAFSNEKTARIGGGVLCRWHTVGRVRFAIAVCAFGGRVDFLFVGVLWLCIMTIE